MEARLLGWAGVQLRDGASSVVIDPLADAGAVFAAAGDLARDVKLPETVEPEAGAAVGLVTHLHRDHADAAALACALAPQAQVLLPQPYGGSDLDNAAIAQAAAELDARGLDLRPVAPWEAVEVDGWRCTAVAAADGAGDPQVSWLVERGGVAIFHGGDTLPHGWWWRIAELAAGPIALAFVPINGARVAFPHRRPQSPLRAVMNAEEAAVAATLLKARRAVPIHYGAYAFPPVYRPDADALERFRAAAEVEVDVPALGAWFDVEAPVVA